MCVSLGLLQDSRFQIQLRSRESLLSARFDAEHFHGSFLTLSIQPGWEVAKSWTEEQIQVYGIRDLFSITKPHVITKHLKYH